jgi:hypothetical protein
MKAYLCESEQSLICTWTKTEESVGRIKSVKGKLQCGGRTWIMHMNDSGVVQLNDTPCSISSFKVTEHDIHFHAVFVTLELQYQLSPPDNGCFRILVPEVGFMFQQWTPNKGIRKLPLKYNSRTLWTKDLREKLWKTMYPLLGADATKYTPCGTLLAAHAVTSDSEKKNSEVQGGGDVKNSLTEALCECSGTAARKRKAGEPSSQVSKCQKIKLLTTESTAERKFTAEQEACEALLRLAQQ